MPSGAPSSALDRNHDLGKDYAQTRSMLRGQRAFTMIELMVAVALAAVMTSMASPWIRSTIQNSRIKTVASDIHLDLMLARSEAAKRNGNVKVCGSSNGTSCSGNWNSGRIVFEDDDNDGTVNGAEVLLRYSAAPINMTSITPTGGMSAGIVTFRSTGQPVGAAGTIALCDTRSGLFGRTVSLSAVGLMTVTKSTCV